MKCAWQKSCGITTEGFAINKISSVVFLFCWDKGEVVGMKLLDFCLEGKYEMIHCVIYSRKQSVYLRAGFDG